MVKAKNVPEIKSFENVTDKHEKLLGHMMKVVA